MIAYNACFDRPFREHLARGLDGKARTCSVSEIPWAQFRFEGSKLGYLIGQCGWFCRGHRAAGDCHALLEVLAPPLSDKTGLPFSHLLAARYCQVVVGRFLWQGPWHEHHVQSLPRFPLSGRDHQPSGLVVSLLQPEPAWS